MERTVLLAAATWVGGVGAWGVGTGYALAAARARSWAAGSGSDEGGAITARMQLRDEDAPTPPVETIDASQLPAPPLPLDASAADTRGAMDEATLAEMEEFLMRQEARMRDARDRSGEEESERSGVEEETDDALDDDDGDEDTAAATATAMAARTASVPRSASAELDLRPPDASALLTESQRRRLAPVKPLLRERRSRKIRKTTTKDEKFVPLVRGARATQEEAILNAFSGESLGVKREQGEDYWVDPEQLESEYKAEQKKVERRKLFKSREQTFGEGKLREEISAPYKNNVIGFIVVGVGLVSVLFAAFPGLLELNEPPSIASFPDTL